MIYPYNVGEAAAIFQIYFELSDGVTKTVLVTKTVSPCILRNITVITGGEDALGTELYQSGSTVQSNLPEAFVVHYAGAVLNEVCLER